MEEHRVETTIECDGILTLEGLPFHAGERVEVSIVARPERSEPRRRFRGTPVTIVDPFEPVAAGEWDASR
jgi:hypothetical protein